MVICIVCNEETKKKLCDDCLAFYSDELSWIGLSVIYEMAHRVMKDVSKITGFHYKIPIHDIMVDIISNARRGESFGSIDNGDMELMWKKMMNPDKSQHINYYDKFVYIRFNLYQIFKQTESIFSLMLTDDYEMCEQASTHMFTAYMQEQANSILIHELCHIITFSQHDNDKTSHGEYFQAVLSHFYHLAGYRYVVGSVNQYPENTPLMSKHLVSEEFVYMIKSEHAICLADQIYLEPDLSAQHCKLCKIL